MFFIVEFADFVKLTPQTIQDIYRKRNIVIRNVPQRSFEWSLDTLSEVGALNHPREVQGMCLLKCNMFSAHIPTVGECRGNSKVSGMLKTGTLQDIFNTASERVLNCLSLPTSTSEIVFTPGLW